MIDPTVIKMVVWVVLCLGTVRSVFVFLVVVQVWLVGLPYTESNLYLMFFNAALGEILYIAWLYRIIHWQPQR